MAGIREAVDGIVDAFGSGRLEDYFARFDPNDTPQALSSLAVLDSIQADVLLPGHGEPWTEARPRPLSGQIGWPLLGRAPEERSRMGSGGSRAPLVSGGSPDDLIATSRGHDLATRSSHSPTSARNSSGCSIRPR